MLYLLLLLVLLPAANAVPLSGCANITSPGYYTLTGSITASGGTCINISAGGVVLDGGGSLITGGGEGVGVYASKVSGVRITNLSLAGFTTGVLLQRVSGASLEGVEVENSTQCILLQEVESISLRGSSARGCQAGITLWDSRNTTLQGNLLLRNYDAVVSGHFSTGNTIAGNTVAKSQRHGIVLWASSNTTVLGNTVSSCGGSGIILLSSSGNLLSENTLSSNGYGVYISGNGNTLSSSVIEGSTRAGVHLSGDGNLIYDNLLNNTLNANVSGVNHWNTSLQAGTNVIGGSYMGGNYWALPNGSGYSDTCTDSDGDGICDAPYAIDANNTDHLPLTSTVGMPEFQGYAALSALLPWVGYLLRRRRIRS